MSESLEALRAGLARRVGRFMTGTATGGSNTTIIDTSGLARVTEDDRLNGGVAYIEDTTDEQEPEGEWRWITDYVASTKTITVAPGYGGAVDAGDVYELFLAPLYLEDWNAALNEAISSAWPEVWEPTIEEIVTTGATNYSLNAAAEGVAKVEVSTLSGLAGRPGQILPRHLWTVEGTPGSLDLYLLRPTPSSSDLKIRVTYMKRYAELAAGESTSLDTPYLYAAARAFWCAMMAGASRGEAAQGGFLQQMAHWQEIAAARKYGLALQLRGLTPEEGKKK